MQTDTQRSARPLMIIGASCRAAAWSALRSGFAPVVFDGFADADLVDRAVAVRIDDYPTGLVAAAERSPPLPWMYTGALENYPDIVDQLTGRRELLGNPGEVLRRVRDPHTLQQVLTHAGFTMPEISEHLPAPGTGNWLIKNYRSAAGLGVRWLKPDQSTASPPHYFQRFIPGTASSALYLGDGRQALLLGMHRQWIGAHELGADGFVYCGSFTVHLERATAPELERLGNVLAREFSLVGLFGVDWMGDENQIWPLEVNPRYTASAELWEWCYGWPLINWHVSACRERCLESAIRAKARHDVSPSRIYGKGILYAPRTFVVLPSFANLVALHNERQAWPRIADIPVAGQTIQAGHPLVTLFAEGTDMQHVQQRILELAGIIRCGVEG